MFDLFKKKLPKIEDWIKAQEFEPDKSYIILVGNKDVQPTGELIDGIAGCMKQFSKSHFVVAPYWIKLVRLKEVEE